VTPKSSAQSNADKEDRNGEVCEEPPKMITTKEVAQLLGRKVSYISYLARLGVLQSVRDKRPRHFIEAEIIAFLDNRRDKEPPPKRLKKASRFVNMKRNPHKTVGAVRRQHYTELKQSILEHGVCTFSKGVYMSQKELGEYYEDEAKEDRNEGKHEADRVVGEDRPETESAGAGSAGGI